MKIQKEKLPQEIVQTEPTELLEEIGTGISIIDRKMRICWVNSTLAKWFGSLRDIKGKFCYNIYQHRNKICPGCPSWKTFKSGTKHSSFQAGFNLKGERRVYHLIASALKNGNGNVSKVLELTSDVTRYWHLKEHRARLLKKFKTLCSRLVNVNKRLRQDINFLKNKSKKTTQLSKNLIEKFHTLETELSFKQTELKDIRDIEKKILATQDLQSILSLIVKLSHNLTHADCAALRMINQTDKSLSIKASIGLSKAYLEASPLKMGRGIPGLVAATMKPLTIKDCLNDSRVNCWELNEKEGIVSCAHVPAIFKEEVLGVISVYFKSLKEISNDEIDLLMSFADQAAIAIHETQLYQDVHINYFNTIRALVLAMEAKDPYTKGHSERVTQYAVRIARELKIKNSEIEILSYASKVHDVGKIGISDIILNKPGKLTTAERALIELHPQKGAEMLMPLKFLEPGIPYIKHHHERFDGQGYPDGLKREQIPLAARILACVDSFDAMTSDRPYRYRRLTPEEAMSEIKLNSGKQFDPTIVNIFMKILKS
ncbi:MAG: HD domain-containing phosphohydrolase [Candidatus Omnitrophota bacterium]|nr:HD domain-containing phosphohydrolase [Candidatus Omnitrophota bacterium]